MRETYEYEAPESEVIRVEMEGRFLQLSGDPQIKPGEEGDGGEY